MFHRSTLAKTTHQHLSTNPNSFILPHFPIPFSITRSLSHYWLAAVEYPALSDKNVLLELMLIIGISRIYAIHLTGWLEMEKEKMRFSSAEFHGVGVEKWKRNSFQCKEQLNPANELQLNGKTHGHCSCHTFLLSQRSGIRWQMLGWLTGRKALYPSVNSFKCKSIFRNWETESIQAFT